MAKTAVSVLFDKVLTLDEGEIITLKFDSLKEMLCKKTMLFREKRKYEARMSNVPSFKSFFIGQTVKEKEGVYIIRLSTNGTSLDWLTNAVIKSKEGEVVPLELDIPAVTEDRLKKLQGK
jgi:hypothetical protein